MDQPSEAGADPRPGRLRLALAARAEADSLRARRAERLARIRAGAALARKAGGPAAAREDAALGREKDAMPAAARDEHGMPAARDEGGELEWPVGDVDALERFLANLVGTIDTAPAPPQPTRLAPVLPLARPPAAPAGDGDDPSPLPGAGIESSRPPGGGFESSGGRADLSRLPGAGPGLVGALIRQGVPDLAALAGLGREALGQKLGPLGRLIDLDGWLAFARDATGRTAPGDPDDAARPPQDLAG